MFVIDCGAKVCINFILVLLLETMVSRVWFLFEDDDMDDLESSNSWFV